MERMTDYPEMPELGRLAESLKLYAQLKHEYGADGVEEVLAGAEGALQEALDQMKGLPADEELAHLEPNELAAIRQRRPDGPRRIWDSIPEDVYEDRLAGALLGRFAGCTLGAPVEFWPVQKMQALAEHNGDDWPPTDYWSHIPEPWVKRYSVSPRADYTRPLIDHVPADDDLTYTLLALLILEEHGPGFGTEQVAEAWLKHLPYAATAEGVALGNLREGVPPLKAGEHENPYREWIGAEIRSDGWAYLAPGWPERAARMAYRDAYLSHRRQGIYGEMLFSAAISAAFAVDDAEEALRIGLTEIPAGCALAEAVEWALEKADQIGDYRQAREAVDETFGGMAGVHTINNASLTIWGLTIGGDDFTRVIGETVAMGMDNDCTGATVGSLAGALLGKSALPQHWYEPFGNRVLTYMKGDDGEPGREFRIDGLLERFARQARCLSDASA